ncbi:hypothetical protein HYH03_001558 [Edaphochlamys debaryana]|uniref:Nucleotide-diphospho-sugar transferase domain-containing protein n=1 Tax=Edaphochlamys debaryana TaxID=47281 RepID=A0A835YH14_9CHLO|nr:hypothetical protein HYH03_001558 [Edaphochlamys debaryana]|eukprot:KAG2500796.1 hypothetical protein HYH03_001558 [Edaphochlamys debaryana]
MLSSLLLCALVAWLSLPGAKAQPVPGSAGTLACAESDMCSIGQVRPYTGDIHPPEALRACLDARTYKKELILLTDTRLNPLYQAFRSLLALGYEHAVALSVQERCDKSAATWPRLGCVWSSSKTASQFKYLMDRVAFLVRAARLGFNVLSLDSDVLPLADLYSLLRQPGLGPYQLAAMRDGNGWINCGVVYARNVRPDGPVAYVLAEIVDRLERWGESCIFMDVIKRPCGCWDQAVYSDTLLSAVAGRPVSYLCWMPPEEKEQVAWDDAHVKAMGRAEGGRLEVAAYANESRVEWPPQLRHGPPGFEARPFELWTATLRVPNTNGSWPQALGGEMFAPERGEVSRAFVELLKADGVPLWPDPENASLADAAAAIGTETFVYLPLWLGESWSHGGGLGHWNPGLLAPNESAPVGLAHFVHVPGGATNKMTVKMATGHWDWDVAHAVHPHRGVFFASTAHTPLPDVLAYSSEVENRAWASEAEFSAAALALLRLAMETGRAAAFPAPRCNLTWLGGDKNTRLPLYVNHGFLIPYSPPGKGFSDLRCLWSGYLFHGCQAARWSYPGGLLAPEFDHLQQLLTQDRTQAAAEHLRSLGFTEGAGAGAGGLGLGASAMTHVPTDLLQPPAGAAAWDVADLAAKLMQMYGGPGSGLLWNESIAAFNANHSHGGAGLNGSSGGGTGGGGARVGGDRPRVLVLSEVPKLAERRGPRHEVHHAWLERGEERHLFGCDWLRTGRAPHRRRALVEEGRAGHGGAGMGAEVEAAVGEAGGGESSQERRWLGGVAAAGRTLG